MKDRIRMIRKELNLTQQEFAERIGIKRNTVANYETGRNDPVDSVISLICREFNVSEEWLRYGAGEMLVHRTRNQQIAEFVNDVMEEDQTSFRKRLIEALSRLKESDWEALEKIASNIANKEEA